jgi:NTP pyrophosphatase (non-canonical NTP hydrolase)
MLLEMSMNPEFSRRNLLRCESPRGFNHKLNSWSASDWMVALTGELGEAANILKKLNRVRDGIPGNRHTPDQLREDLALEMADVYTYMDLFCQAAGIDLRAAVEKKFADTSFRIGYEESQRAATPVQHKTESAPSPTMRNA